MAITVPLLEPTYARSGDTWQWRRENLADYPASIWSLKYYFRNANDKFDITATADGEAFTVTVAKAVTAALRVGAYDWVAMAESATERYQVAAGRIEVKPNLALDKPFDARSFARKMLEAIEAALLEQATSDQLDLVSAGSGDRSITRDKDKLTRLRDRFRKEVQDEDRKQRGVRSNRILAVG